MTIGENEGTASNYVYVTSKTGEDGVDQEPMLTASGPGSAKSMPRAS